MTFSDTVFFGKFVASIEMFLAFTVFFFSSFIDHSTINESFVCFVCRQKQVMLSECFSQSHCLFVECSFGGKSRLCARYNFAAVNTAT